MSWADGKREYSFVVVLGDELAGVVNRISRRLPFLQQLHHSWVIHLLSRMVNHQMQKLKKVSTNFSIRLKIERRPIESVLTNRNLRYSSSIHYYAVDSNR